MNMIMMMHERILIQSQINFSNLFMFVWNTGCPKINFTFLNVNNIRTNIRIATPAIYIDRGHL